jgi:hypothetical protein
VSAAKKAKNALRGGGGASGRHITKLEQSRFSSDIYGFTHQKVNKSD